MIACHECDLLQREVHLPLGGIVRCGRCGAELYRSHPDSFDRSLALTAGAIVLFILANSFPIVGLKLQGQVIQTTLLHTVQTLWNEDMKSAGNAVMAPVQAVGALM